MSLRKDPYAFRAESVDDALPNLLRILLHKEDRPSRNGVTKEISGLSLTLDRPLRRYVTTPGRRVSLPAQIVETMWVLSGKDHISTIQPYLPRAAEFSDDGQVWRGAYGKRIRRFAMGGDHHFGGVDQLAHVVKLLRENLDTRRAVISIYDPRADTDPGKDIPCNDFLIFRARSEGLLDLHVTTRSNDVIWGWSGINTFEWSVLLELVALMTGLGVGSIKYSVSSFHLYEHHYAKAQQIVDTQLTHAAMPLAGRASLSGIDDKTTIKSLDGLLDEWFALEEAIRVGSTGNLPQDDLDAQINAFPVDAMRVWLRVLRGWWNDNMVEELAEFKGTSLYAAAVESPKCKHPHPKSTPFILYTGVSENGMVKLKDMLAEINTPDALQSHVPTSFTEFVAGLHREKNAAYGDSWKRRGEMLGIMANIARKVDRLGVAGGGDTSADTAIDLLVYLIKYRLWLVENVHAEDAFDGAIPERAGDLTEDPEWVTTVLKTISAHVPAEYRKIETDRTVAEIRQAFDRLEELVAQKDIRRGNLVEELAKAAHPLAVRLWAAEQPGHEVIGQSTTKRFNGYATTEDEEG